MARSKSAGRVPSSHSISKGGGESGEESDEEEEEEQEGEEEEEGEKGKKEKSKSPREKEGRRKKKVHSPRHSVTVSSGQKEDEPDKEREKEREKAKEKAKNHEKDAKENNGESSEKDKEAFDASDSTTKSGEARISEKKAKRSTGGFQHTRMKSADVQEIFAAIDSFLDEEIDEK